MDKLRIVSTPTVLKKEPKILCYTGLELIVLILICVFLFILLSNYFSITVSFIFSAIPFLAITLMKTLASDEVGVLFPIYDLLFLFKRKEVYSKETNNHIVKLDIVSDNIIKFDGKYCAIIEVIPLNFLYYTSSCKRSVLDSFRRFLNTIDFPFQILSISYEFDAEGYINELIIRSEENDVSTNHLLKEVINDYIFWLYLNIKNTHMRKYFVILSATGDRNLAISELKRRIRLIISAFSSINIKTKILGKNEILNLYEIINRRRQPPNKYS